METTTADLRSTEPLGRSEGRAVPTGSGGTFEGQLVFATNRRVLRIMGESRKRSGIRMDGAAL